MKSYEKIRYPHILFGSGTSEQVGKKFKLFGVTNCLIITDIEVVKLGFVDKIAKFIEDEGIKYDVYDKINSCFDRRLHAEGNRR